MFTSMTRQRFLMLAAAGASAAFLRNNAMAQVKLGDINYAGEVTLAGQRLLLNGFGMRFRLGFRIYAAALYTPSRVSRDEDVVKPTLAKRLHLVAQRDLKGDEFGKLFTRGMEENMSKENFSKIINGVLRLSTMFAEARTFPTGDVIVLDVVPGTGLIVTFRGKQQGEPIKEPEFSESLFRIWFGKKPADDQLRKALLGEQTTANTNIF